MPKLTKCPAEILLKILLYLEKEDVGSFMRSSKRLPDLLTFSFQLYDPNSQTQLFHAVRLEHVDSIKELILAGVDPNHQDKYAKTALHLAAGLGQVEYLHLLADVDQNRQDKNGRTALHLATSRGHEEFIAKLLHQAGTNQDLQDKYGQTALHLAASAGQLAIVELMLGDELTTN